jgi:hypothetical protein
MTQLAWRKFMTDPPPAWQRLPVLVRGVGDELLRTLDRAGEIDCGAEPPEDVVLRLCAAHPRERKMVRSAIRQLVAEGFLDVVEADGRTTIRGLLPDLSISADRPKVGVRSTQGAPKVDVPQTQGAPKVDARSTQGDRMFPANSAEPLKSGPGEKSREEERREEKRREEEPPTPPEQGKGRRKRQPVVASEAEQAVFEHWRTTIGKTAAAKLDEKRQQRIEWALATYGLDAVKRCIDGYSRSPHHMGQNDRNTRYDDIELFLRDAKHVEAGLAMADSPPKPGGRLPPADIDPESARESRQLFEDFFGTIGEVANG